ncbi:hypothetical protein DFH09DRAFT_1109977 [Mycena vulgaris]|nr:hypothetical protein DFH09DRAFT_1109977 [Mycena vulgaris]
MGIPGRWEPPGVGAPWDSQALPWCLKWLPLRPNIIHLAVWEHPGRRPGVTWPMQRMLPGHPWEALGGLPGASGRLPKGSLWEGPGSLPGLVWRIVRSSRESVGGSWESAGTCLGDCKAFQRLCGRVLWEGPGSLPGLGRGDIGRGFVRQWEAHGSLPSNVAETIGSTVGPEKM